jgi:hypothetical protein
MHFNPGHYCTRRQLTAIKILAQTLLMTFVITDVAIASLRSRGPEQEKSADNQQQTAKADKPEDTTVSGIIVNEKGVPVKGQALELYMVVNGIARDAYGAPLQGAVTIGPSRQVLGLMMFPVKKETDANGQFSMKLPKYVMVPGGIEMTGWTIVALDAAGKASTLTIKGEMVSIVTKPETSKVDLGKLTLSASAPSQK